MFTFEDKKDVIDNELRKRKSRWFLGSSTGLDFDDVSQIIRAHIYIKWSLWDQTKPLEPYLNRVISNQIKNLIRNNYGVFAKPCASCPFNEESCVESDACSFTSSKKQSNECPLFKKWAAGKQKEYNIKMAVPFENQNFQLKTTPSDDIDLEKAAIRLREIIKTRVTKKQYLAYTLLYVENLSDEEVSRRLGYKTSEKNRPAGYRQIKNLKNILQKLAKEIVESEDIFYG